MNIAADGSHARLRWGVYWILIAVGTGALLGRVGAVDSVDRVALEQDRLKRIEPTLQKKRQQFEKRDLAPEVLEEKLAEIEEGLYRSAKQTRPFLSANDRSRWCTLRALVEDDLRVEGYPFSIDKVIQEPGWDTIDMVKHDGHVFSSKPPLYPVMMAGVYWGDLQDHGHDLGNASLCGRSHDARAAQRVADGALLLRNCAPRRTVCRDRLEPDVRDGHGRLRHVF